MNPSLSFAPAIVNFQDGTPFCALYDDIYFSKADGMAESQHVFLNANQLETRFANANSHFIIAETGFGTGLNFLLTVRLWLATAPIEATLHYISIEKHPIDGATLAQLYAQHPLAAEWEGLAASYPLLLSAIHTRLLYNKRIRLTLLFADIADALDAIPINSVDAWFLDGFSPAKNPDMWKDSYMYAVAKRTKKGGTFATFTAAGQVKRALSAGGFTVTKQRGYGYKRDMLVGYKH